MIDVPIKIGIIWMQQFILFGMSLTEEKIVSVAELVETKAAYYRAAFWVDEFAAAALIIKSCANI